MDSGLALFLVHVADTLLCLSFLMEVLLYYFCLVVKFIRLPKRQLASSRIICIPATSTVQVSPGPNSMLTALWYVRSFPPLSVLQCVAVYCSSPLVGLLLTVCISNEIKPMCATYVHVHVHAGGNVPSFGMKMICYMLLHTLTCTRACRRQCAQSQGVMQQSQS